MGLLAVSMEGVWLLAVAVLVGNCWSPLLVDAQEASAPSAPIIEAVSLSPTSINLNWTQPTEDVVISYEITFSYQGPCSGFTHTNTITVDGSSSTHTLSGLQEFSNYAISVTAVNDAGNATTTEMVTTLSAVPSGAPQAVWVLVTGGSTIYVQWDRVSCMQRNSEITGYTVRYAPSNGVGTHTVSGTATSERAYLISGLSVSTQYNIMIAANSIGGTTGPFSSPIAIWTPDVGLTLINVNYANNSVVTITDIREGAEALHCTTTLQGCCFSGTGGWFFPNGSVVVNNNDLPYYRTRAQNPGSLLLHRSMGTTTGIFRCDIPDVLSVMQSLYVGIYTSTTGNLEVTSLQFWLTTDLNVTIPNFTITCTSTGGPVTTFSWRRDGALVTNNNSYSVAPQGVTDPVSGTYSHILTVTGRRAGQYECSVANNRPSMDTGNLTIETAGPPTGLVVEQVGPTSVRVSWTAPITVATVTGYQIYYLAEGDWGNVSVSAGVTSHTLNNLKDGFTYNITMVARSMHLPSSVVGPQTVTLEVSTLTLEVTGPNAAIAGQTISLTCTVTRGENISVTPDVQWLGPDGYLLLSGSGGIMVDSTTMVSNSTFNRTLWFTPVQTSHRGWYTCQAMADSVNQREAISLSVQIAAPTVVVSVETPTYSGTNTTLNCTITLSAAVDTVVDASWVNVAWTGPHGPISSNSSVAISDVTGSNNVYESTLTFSPLMSTATGNYMCEAVINPVNEAFLLMSNAGSGYITVQGANPPTNLSAEPAGPTSIRIFWTPPASGATVVGYRISYLGEGAQDTPMHHGSVDIGASATQHTLSDLQRGLWYTITMTAMSQHIPSTVVGPVRATLTMVRVKVVNATALVVSWDALRNTDHYTIYYSALSPALFKVVDHLTIVVPSTRTSDVIVIKELTTGVEHQFQVTATLEVQGEVYEKSIPTKIEFDEAAFHLQMGPVSPCTTWSTDKAETIRTYIHSGIAKAISYHCNCSFSVEFIREGLFRCWKAPDEFSYRSAIVGTEAHNATELVQFLEEWVNSEPVLQVEQFELWVGTTCPVSISSLKLRGVGKCL